MKILFIIGLILLCINVLRFVLGNIVVIKNKDIKISLKIWNIIETLGMSTVLIILIINYYK